MSLRVTAAFFQGKLGDVQHLYMPLPQTRCERGVGYWLAVRRPVADGPAIFDL